MWLSSLKINVKWKSVKLCVTTHVLWSNIRVIAAAYKCLRRSCHLSSLPSSRVCEHPKLSINKLQHKWQSQHYKLRIAIYNFPHIVCSRWMRHPIIFDLWVQIIFQPLKDTHTHNRADAFHFPQLHRGAESAHRGCDPIGRKQEKTNIMWSEVGLLFSCSRGKPKDTWLHAEWVVRFSVIHCTHIRRIAKHIHQRHASKRRICVRATVFVYLCVRSVLYNRHSKVDYYHLPNQTSRWRTLSSAAVLLFTVRVCIWITKNWVIVACGVLFTPGKYFCSLLSSSIDVCFSQKPTNKKWKTV